MKFYGQGKPSVDRVLYESYFKDKYSGICIECGALDGVRGSCCKFFEEFMDWSSINIEPSPYLYEMLIKNRPDSINLNIALSDKIGESTFTHAIHPTLGKHFGNGSLKHTEEHIKRLKKQGCKFEEYKVKTTTFKDLVKAIGLEDIDLFTLDVEGHEPTVIKTLSECHVLPKVMCIEHSHINEDKLNEDMRSLGYRLDQKVFVNSYFTR
jgi:FkbM family methyltransferase